MKLNSKWVLMRSYVCALPLFAVLLTSIHTQVSGQTAGYRIVIATPNFSMDSDTLDKKTRGINFEKLYDDIRKKFPDNRTEFETKAEYVARLEKFNESTFVGGVRNDSRVAVMQMVSDFPARDERHDYGYSPTAESKYDPEKEEMSIKISGRTDCLPLNWRVKTTGTYIAQNGFGSKFKVTEQEATESCVRFFSNNGGISQPTVALPMIINFSLLRKAAEATSKTMQIMILGRLVRPYFDYVDKEYKPKATDPTALRIVQKTLVLEVDDVWVVNTKSGAVLGKLRGFIKNPDPQ